MPNWKKVIVSGSNAVLNHITASGNISGSAISTASFGTYLGDGSQLDGVNAFPFSGDALITGSLIISASNNTSQSLQVQGSGSTIFSVQGSQAQLFSVTDDLLHDNLVVNDISGDTIFKVSGSGLVTIPVGDLSGSGAATASYGHFIGDGGGLTNLNTTTPTLQEVTAQGNITDQGLIVSGSTIFKPTTSSPASIEFSTEAYSGQRSPTITLKNNLNQKTVHIGQSESDGLFELYNSTETRVVSIQEHFQAFSPPQNHTKTGAGTYFGVTSSISPTVASPDSYVKIMQNGYSAIPYTILQVNKKGTFAGYDGHQNNSSGSITLQGITNANNNSAPTVAITSVNGNRVVNFGGPGFVNAANVHNNYLKYGLQIGGDFTGNSSNMALTDGSLIMSGSTGGFSVKSVSSEAEIKTNDGDTTLTLGTTSSFSYVTASAFKGDGSQLTNLNTTTPTLAQVVTAGASATGDVQITGSLIISQSSTTGDIDSTALRLFGSGSISESGIFEVEGSAGPLFSVQDGLDGVLMEVNNISGLPLFQVSSSNEVFVNRGNLTSGVNTATASFAMFSGSFQGNGSQLTNISAGNVSGNVGSADTASFALTASSYVAVGTTKNLVVFTTSSGKLTSGSGFEYNPSTKQLTVESLNVVHLTSSFITSSRIHTSGSNIFGDDTTDTQTLIGTIIMTGSAQITGSLTGTPGTTNNLTASYAITASHALSSLTATTASFALSSSLVLQEDSVDKLTDVRNIDFQGNAVALTTGAPNPGGSVIVAINTGSISTPTLQEVTTQGSSTTIPITASILSATASNAYGTTADSLTVKGGDGIHSGGTNGGNLNLQGGDSSGASGTRKGGNVVIRGGEGATSSGSISITGDTLVTGSITIEKSGSTVFEVIGSEGTLFTIDDDLDGVIFTANNRTGNPILQASASGEVYIGKAPQSLYTTAVISSTTANISQSIFGLSTSSYGGVFVDYTANSGSNARAGSIVSVWNGSSINFTETTTLDIGNTSNLLMQVAISQSQAQVQSYATTAGYNIKTIIRSI